MANIKADEITKILREQIENYQQTVAVDEVGSVISVGDGIARVHGLEKVHGRRDARVSARRVRHRAEPRRRSGRRRAARRLHGNQGRRHVKRTNKIMSVPVGDALIGRVVDPLGEPLDGKGPIQTNQRNPLERIAPGVVDRQPVREPLQTGIKAIDSMIPIGRGQRELIIGDRQTGKTAIILDTILNQRGGDMICIYCAIGQKRSTIAQVVKTLTDNGAMEYTIVVAASATEPATMQYIAPFAACAMGEYFRDSKRHAVCFLRRSFEARAVVPRNFAAAAASAGARSVSGRRFLPALAPAGTRGEIERQTGRRFADGAAGDRNAGGRRVSVHSDERDFDYRRSDLSRSGSCSMPAFVPRSTWAFP